MTGWPDLVTTALLGTDRREVPTDLPDDLASFAARIAPGDPAGRLLDLVAGCTAYARAGAVPQGCPPPQQAPPSDAEPAPPAAQRMLAGLVAMRAPVLVTEWLQLCVGHGRSVAPELWPGLAELAASSRALDRELLRSALGERGAWFLSHSDRWRGLVKSERTSPQEVHDGGSDARTDGATSDAESPRRRDEIRPELDKAWGRARADDKVAFLRALAPDLAADDEPRLLRALRDRSTDVREEAARLLSRLPESGYVRRMTDRATAAVVVTRSLGRRKVVVTQPDPDRTKAEDGISDKPPRGFPAGPGAFMLRQVLGATPLSVWASATGLEPAALLDASARTAGDWFGDLRAGWALAAERQADTRWAEALLAAGGVAEGLLPLVSDEARLRVAVGWTRKGAHVERAAELILACLRPWPAELTQAALGLFSSGALWPSSRRFADEAGHAMGVDGYPVLEQHVLGWVPRRGMSLYDAAQVRAGHARMEELLATRIAIRQGFSGGPTTIRRFAVPHLS